MAVWANTDASAFEKNIPLVLLGERNRRLGSKVDFEVLFLEGLKLLSDDYRERLSGLGYRLHDAESCYQELKRRYFLLERFGDYDRKCFLRWLVIRDFCGNVPFVHYDADIVFNATPEEIDVGLLGMTFILQGCPAYARIEDPTWLGSYATELDRFVANIEAYSADAWRQRPSFVSIYRERGGSLWDRSILSSDQDLMEFLTLAGRLPQADAASVNSRCSSILFKSPVMIGSDTHLPLPLQYERREGIDYLTGRKVGFWHMHNAFAEYLGYATFLNQLRIGGQIPWVRSQVNRPLNYTAYRALLRVTSAYSREQLIRRYFGKYAQDLGFLLNGERYWQSSVFT